MSKTEGLLSSLQGLRKTGPDSWVACCPAHDDSTPSLAIKETDEGVVLLHCFGGCSVEAVAAAAGVKLADLFPDGATPYKGRQQIMPVREAAEQMRMACLSFLMSATSFRAQYKGVATEEQMEDMVNSLGHIEHWRETLQRVNK